MIFVVCGVQTATKYGSFARTDRARKNSLYCTVPMQNSE